jgi:hypothetical protein
MIDTSRTLKIESSPAKLVGYLGLGLLATAGSIFVVLRADPFRKLVGAFGTVFFGLYAA